MTDSNQTSQPAGSDREEVLKAYPKAYLSSDGTIRTPSHRGNITYGKFLGMDWADVRSRLPNAPASEDNTSLPMEYIIRHGIGVSVPAPHPAPEPEEQGEQTEGFYETLDRKCWENSGTAQLLRERPENLHDYQGCVNDPKMQPSTTVPSQPELPPLSKPITTSKYWDTSIDRPLAGERAVRLERQDQLLAALREDRQLQKQVEASRHAGEVLMRTSNANLDRFKVAEQQLAQKDARIAELEGGEVSTTQEQYLALTKKEKQMNLGPRCNFMLPSRCQCPNTALADSDMCELHKEFQIEQAVAVEQAKIEKLEK